MKRTLLSLVAFAAMAFSSNAQVTGINVGQAVPDFTVTDVHGNTHTLSDITNSGKWVVIDFFFANCGPCQSTVPSFSELHEKYGCNEGDIFCISISSQDDDAGVLAFENTYATVGGFNPAPAVSYSQGGGDAVIAAFSPSAYPTYCLVGSDMTLKSGDIWPVNSVASLESAITGAGHTINEMACATSGLEEVTALNDVTVYPNPAASSTTISANIENASEVTIKVYNMVGAVVSTEVYSAVSGNNEFNLNTSNLENGQYIVNVSLGEQLTEKQINLNILR